MSRIGALRLALVLSALAFVGFLTYALSHAIDHRSESAYSRDLRQLETADAELDLQLLESRAGLVKHYDALVASVRRMRGLLRALDDPPDFVDAQSERELRSALERTGALLTQKAEYIEQFKTHHAVLRNSLHFIPSVANRVMAHAAARSGYEGLGSRIGGLLSGVMSLGVAPEQGALDRLAARVADVQSAMPDAAEWSGARDLGILLSHTRLVLRSKPLVDARVRDALSLPLGANVAQLSRRHSDQYRRALDQSGALQRTLFGLAIVIVVLGLLDVILRVQSSRARLEATGHELARANQALERERQKERELGELKSRFVAMTSHEFRTPLAAILSSTELLEAYAERWDRERRMTHLLRIKTSVLSMSQMLDQILVIGKAEAGVLRPNPLELDLDGFCRNLIETFESSGREARNGSKTRIQYSFAGERRVSLDELLLRHVLSNLLENALKYSPEGTGVDLDVRVEAEECRFVVRDRGIGIPTEDVPRIFESFQRGSNVGQISGSGLGMAVVRRALGVQRGLIDVSSTPGSGSEFRVQIPLEGKNGMGRAEA